MDEYIGVFRETQVLKNFGQIDQLCEVRSRVASLSLVVLECGRILRGLQLFG